jgi:DNA-binding XRE family transcriptional regulator
MPRRLTLSPRATLAQVRAARALSLRELAHAAGVSPKTCWRIEHGLNVPLPRVRRALAAALRCDPQHIHWPEKEASSHAE